MEIYIRNSRLDEYKQISAIMKQVQQMHIDWRPDIYKYNETVLPLEVYEQAVKDNTIFVDSMAVDKDYRGKGIGHAFFDFLKELKLQKGYDGIELQINAKNEAAYKMYTDYGFTKKSINMELL